MAAGFQAEGRAIWANRGGKTFNCGAVAANCTLHSTDADLHGSGIEVEESDCGKVNAIGSSSRRLDVPTDMDNILSR